MTQRAEELEFRVDDTAAVLAHMQRLAAAHRGWLNLQPGVGEEDVPPPAGGLGILFSMPSHEVPVCTWVPGRVARGEQQPDSIGVQHATGTRVVARLSGLGVPLPEGWRWVQDHPRRGLVVRTPVGTPYAEQLAWLLEAGTALATVPLTGEWRALVYEGR